MVFPDRYLKRDLPGSLPQHAYLSQSSNGRHGMAAESKNLYRRIRPVRLQLQSESASQGTRLIRRADDY